MVNRLSNILCDEVCSSVPCYAPADVARWSLLALLPPLPPCPPSASAGSLRYSGRTMRSRALFAILGEPPNIVPCWFNELHLRYFIEMCEPRLGRLPHRCGPGQVRCRPHCSQPCQCQAQTHKVILAGVSITVKNSRLHCPCYLVTLHVFRPGPLHRYEGSGPNKKVSYLRAKMRCWNPHTVLFWDGKALACHITGLFNMQEDLFSIDVGVFGVGDGL